MTPRIHHRRRHKLIEVLRWPAARPAPPPPPGAGKSSGESPRQAVTPPAPSVNGDGQPNPSANGTAQAVPSIDPPPIRREHYLSRFGSAATLMTVETFTAPDGTERRRVRFAPWPGL